MFSLKNIYRKCRNCIAKIYHNLLPFRNVIVFESLPDLSDNSKAVFDEMIQRGMNNKYTMVWAVDGDPDSFPKIPNVVYYNKKDANQLRQYGRVCVRAKCLISCNGFLASCRLFQPSFYLNHGSPLKRTRGLYDPPKGITYFLAAAPGFLDMLCEELNAPKNKFFTLGFPRNDALTGSRQNIKNFFNGEFKKIIVWYPTYRQHKIGFRTASQHALPIIYDEKYAKLLNDAAKDSQVLIVVKPHFVQDVSYIQNAGLSNIQFIDDDFYKDHGISPYAFIGSCDALITDYSSIYYDYTLCNKPIAAVWEDIEEYKQKPGLIDAYEYYMAGAEKVYTIEDLIGFIQRVADDVDLLANDRRKIRDLVNYSTDGQNARRVVDFIVAKAKL